MIFHSILLILYFLPAIQAQGYNYYEYYYDDDEEREAEDDYNGNVADVNDDGANYYFPEVGHAYYYQEGRRLTFDRVVDGNQKRKLPRGEDDDDDSVGDDDDIGDDDGFFPPGEERTADDDGYFVPGQEGNSGDDDGYFVPGQEKTTNDDDDGYFGPGRADGEDYGGGGYYAEGGEGGTEPGAGEGEVGTGGEEDESVDPTTHLHFSSPILDPETNDNDVATPVQPPSESQSTSQPTLAPSVKQTIQSTSSPSAESTAAHTNKFVIISETFAPSSTPLIYDSTQDSSISIFTYFIYAVGFVFVAGLLFSCFCRSSNRETMYTRVHTQTDEDEESHGMELSRR